MSKPRIFLILLLVGFPISLITMTVIIGGMDASPPDVSDLVLERTFVPDEENAFPLLEQAAGLFDEPTNGLRLAEMLESDRFDAQAARDILDRNEEALDLLEHGLARRFCQLPEATDYSTLRPWLSNWGKLGRILALRAVYERRLGRWKQATGTCQTLLSFGDAVQKNAECLIDYIVGVAILETGLTRTRSLARADGMPEAELARIQQTLVGLGPLDSGLIRCIKAEYRAAAAALDDICSGKSTLGSLCSFAPAAAARMPVPSYWLHPNRTKQALAHCGRAAVSNAPLVYAEMDFCTSNLPAPGKMFFARAVRRNAIGEYFRNLVAPSYDGILKRKCRAEAHIAAARLLVACRLYGLARGNPRELPESLEALVPQYLDAVPHDPLDGRPFRYSKSAAIVYSVGEDLKDAGGSRAVRVPLAPGRQPDDIWSAEDAVFDLLPVPAPPSQ